MFSHFPIPTAHSLHILRITVSLLSTTAHLTTVCYAKQDQGKNRGKQHSTVRFYSEGPALGFMAGMSPRVWGSACRLGGLARKSWGPAPRGSGCTIAHPKTPPVATLLAQGACRLLNTAAYSMALSLLLVIRSTSCLGMPCWVTMCRRRLWTADNSCWQIKHFVWPSCFFMCFCIVFRLL